MYFICIVCILLFAANGVINDDNIVPSGEDTCISASGPYILQVLLNGGHQSSSRLVWNSPPNNGH